MIVEDEWDGYTQFDVSEFQEAEDNGSSHVDPPFYTYMPTNIANMMGVRTTIRDPQMHQQLKDDLVEHLWRKEGHDDDAWSSDASFKLFLFFLLVFASCFYLKINV